MTKHLFSYKYKVMCEIKKLSICATQDMSMDIRITMVLLFVTCGGGTSFYGPCNTTDMYLVTVSTEDTITHEVRVDSKNFSTYQRLNNASWNDLGKQHKNWTLEQIFSLHTLLTQGIRSTFAGVHVIVSLIYVLNPLRTNSNRLLCINDTLISNHTFDKAYFWRPHQKSGQNVVSIIRNYTEHERNYTIPYKIIELLGNGTLNCTCTNPEGQTTIKNKGLNCTCRNSTIGHLPRSTVNFTFGSSCGTVESNVSISLYDWDDDEHHVRNITVIYVFIFIIICSLCVVCIFKFRERIWRLIDRGLSR